MQYKGTIIQGFEGLRLERYQDQRGIWTIGYGHLWKPGDPLSCTYAQALEWLDADVGVAENCINTHVLPTVSITQNQFDALVSLTYNIGTGAFLSSTVYRETCKKDFPRASLAFLEWDKITVDGKLVSDPGLLRRRIAERYLFDTPEDA